MDLELVFFLLKPCFVLGFIYSGYVLIKRGVFNIKAVLIHAIGFITFAVFAHLIEYFFNQQREFLFPIVTAGGIWVTYLFIANLLGGIGRLFKIKKSLLTRIFSIVLFLPFLILFLLMLYRPTS